MKIELTIHERSIVANLLRRRALEAHNNAESTTSDRQKVEWLEEARNAETLAIRFDDGEALTMTEPTPIKPRPRIDLDMLDETGGGNRVT